MKDLIERLERTYAPSIYDSVTLGAAILAIERMTWNTDMDAAPKDGTRVLGLTSFGVEPVKWHESILEEYDVESGWVGTEQDSQCLVAVHTHRGVAKNQPTKWMHLPESTTT